MRHQPAAMRPWKRCFLLVALVLTPAISRGDTISTQVTCAIPGQPGIIAVGSCSQQDANYNAAQESITTSIVRPGSAANYFRFDLADTAMAAAQGGIYGASAQATSWAGVAISLETTGPQRSGFLEIVPSIYGGSPYAATVLSFSIGALQGSCGGFPATCDFATMRENYPSFPALYTFTLGSPFSFDLTYSNMLDAGYEDGRADTTLNLTLDFRFLESDGVTPAALNPEPATWALACTGILGAFLFSRRKQTAHRKN